MAWYSHFCLRMITWEDSHFTSEDRRKDLRKALPLEGINAVATLLCQKLQNLSDEEKIYLTPGQYCMELDGRKNPNAGLMLNLEHWIVVRFVRGGATWPEVLDLLSRDKNMEEIIAFDESQFIGHLKVAFMQHHKKCQSRGRSCPEKDDVPKLVRMFYNCWTVPGTL